MSLSLSILLSEKQNKTKKTGKISLKKELIKQQKQPTARLTTTDIGFSTVCSPANMNNGWSGHVGPGVDSLCPEVAAAPSCLQRRARPWRVSAGPHWARPPWCSVLTSPESQPGCLPRQGRRRRDHRCALGKGGRGKDASTRLGHTRSHGLGPDLSRGASAAQRSEMTAHPGLYVVAPTTSPKGPSDEKGAGGH